MSSDIVIRAEALGKKYVIGHQAERERYTTMRDVVERNLRNWARSVRDMVRGQALVAGDETEEFWALKGINFEIKRGEVVGIIGRNGAGKSTLLKVLSRITEPTTGRVTIDGRVASLLEVGTGFHPELTGRENIYLNGAILGMSRAEIKRKFYEIVDFAGTEKFLDTPVKRYSSGMYVRLAFAVAAHLEPEILIVDEVLAVGDAEFQEKCLGKMKDVATSGRTVLFVSHNMGAIQQLCKRVILLAEGSVVDIGSTSRLLGQYMGGNSSSSWHRAGPAQGEVWISRASLELKDGRSPTLQILLEIHANIPTAASLDILIKDRALQPILFASDGTHNLESPNFFKVGKNKVSLTLNLPPMAIGDYYISIFITRPFEKFYDKQDDVLKFNILRIEDEHPQRQPLNQDWKLGLVQVTHSLLCIEEIV